MKKKKKISSSSFTSFKSYGKRGTKRVTDHSLKKKTPKPLSRRQGRLTTAKTECYSGEIFTQFIIILNTRILQILNCSRLFHCSECESGRQIHPAGS